VSDDAGTLERLALGLAAALAPLERDLEAGNVDSLLRQLGMGALAAVPVPAGLSSALNTTTAAAAALPARIGALSGAIAAGNAPQIIAEGTSTISATVDVLDGIDAIAGQLPAALTGAGVPAADAGTFAGQFARRLTSYAFVRFLEENKAFVLGALGAVGLVDRVELPNVGGAGSHLDRSLRLDRIGNVVSDPGSALRTAYGWGDPAFDGRDLLRRIADLLRGASAVVAFDETAAVPELDLRFFSIRPTTGPGPRGLVLTIHETVPDGFSGSADISPRVRAEAHLDASLEGGLAITIVPPSTIDAEPSAALTGRARVGISYRAPNGRPSTLLGIAGGIGVRADSLSIGAGTDWAWDAASGKAHGELAIGGDIHGGKLTIDFTQADGFLGSILSATRVDVAFDAGFDWSISRGLRLRGSSGLELKIPTHLALGPIGIETLTLSGGVSAGSFPISFAADVKGSLGAIEVIVEEIGATALLSFPASGRGLVGPVDLEFAFKPPKGAGLSVDTGVIKGGGYLHFDPDAGEYFGALELSFQGFIDLKAFGLVNTKFPDGHQGFAFLILITAEFAPIQLGFGFTLLGVGGLLSVNRTLDTPALMAGVKTGAINSILFPQDVVANIARIASDIKTVFPLAEGHFVIAPMGKIGWGTPTLISLELGVIVDIPMPQIAIIGVLRCLLPTEDTALLALQVNFAGGIDFGRGLLWFNASLFDSRLLAFTLEGDMAVRLGWGESSMLVLTVGGFHPAFREVPDDLRNMTRLTISLLSGSNPRITVQTYFAVTSNTVQSGAKVELYAAACGFNVYGFLGYDLLVQFNPLHFIADLYAGLALRAGTSTIAGVSLRGQLSGPTPWNANGEASLEILFFSITVGFNETWGDEEPAQPIEIEDVTGLMRSALKDDRNWRVEVPANSTTGVSVHDPNLAGGTIVIQPFAILSVSQKVAPLGIPLEKFGNKKPDRDLFEVTTPLTGSAEAREEFAIANFKKLSDSDKLSAKSFEQMRSGLRFSTGDAAETGARTVIEVDYELSYVHRSSGLVIFAGLVKLASTLFATLVGGSAATKNAFSKTKTGAIKPATIHVADAGFLVVATSDLSIVGAPVAMTMAEAAAQQDALILADPTLAGTLQVVASHEVGAAA
jgi:hypothetical protein